MNKITVIGGGAAGLMAAIAAAKNGAQVSLIEPNERLGKKINITGKGRCNVTNDTDLEGLMAHIPRNGTIPLQCTVPLYQPGHHGVFRGLRRAAEGGAGRPGVSGVRQRL